MFSLSLLILLVRFSQHASFYLIFTTFVVEVWLFILFYYRLCTHSVSSNTIAHYWAGCHCQKSTNVCRLSNSLLAAGTLGCLSTSCTFPATCIFWTQRLPSVIPNLSAALQPCVENVPKVLAYLSSFSLGILCMYLRVSLPSIILSKKVYSHFLWHIRSVIIMS